MRKVIYVFNDKDYSHNNIVNLTFYVQRISIENFIKLAKSNGLCWKIDKDLFKDNHHTNTDGYMKTVIIRGFASSMFRFLISLGFHEHSNIYDGISIRHNNLRNEKINNRIKWDQVYIKFNSITKETKFVYNTPFKINRISKQGKILWRRFH